MAFDLHKNLAVSSVLTAPTPASSGGTLVVKAGEGARFPAAPFNVTIWPVNALPTPANAEIARCTAVTGDTLTLTRAQEGSTARLVGVGDLIAATITARSLQDIETQAALLAAPNTFTGTPQRIQAVAPTLAFLDTSAPPNTGTFDLVSYGQLLQFRALNDAQSVITGQMNLYRTGALQVGSTISERGRVSPIGTAEPWITSGTTAEGAPIGGTVVAHFAAVGNLIFISLACTSFTIPAPTSTLVFPPPNKYPQVTGDVTMLAKIFIPGSGFSWGSASLQAGYPVVGVTTPTSSWPAGVGHVQLQGFYFSPN